MGGGGHHFLNKFLHLFKSLPYVKLCTCVSDLSCTTADVPFAFGVIVPSKDAQQ